MPNMDLLWHDLTVPQADSVRDFYCSVFDATWKGEDMGDYEDYHIVNSEGDSVTGIVWCRGVNAKMPACWMLYFRIDDLDAALAKVTAGGGEILDGPRSMGSARFAAVKDPAGAAFALFQP